MEAEIPSNRRIFDVLEEEMESRKIKPVENSYTNYLFEKGIDKIAKKFIEEAGEVIIAAKNNSKSELIYETADLLFHTFVLLSNQNVKLSEVEAELQARSAKKATAKATGKNRKMVMKKDVRIRDILFPLLDAGTAGLFTNADVIIQRRSVFHFREHFMPMPFARRRHVNKRLRAVGDHFQYFPVF